MHHIPVSSAMVPGNVRAPLALPLRLSRVWMQLGVLLIGLLVITHGLKSEVHGLSGSDFSDVSAGVNAVHRARHPHRPRRKSTHPTFTEKVTDGTANHNNRLCVQLKIALVMTNFTLPFTEAALEWIVNSALSSLRNQTSAQAAWPNSWEAVLSIVDRTVNRTLWEEHQNLVNATLHGPVRKLQQEGIQLFVTGHGRQRRSLKQLVAENPQCAWVAKIRLDADDVLAPGYFEYISNEIVVKNLEGTLTTEGRSWLGALIASRKLNRVVLGKGVCEAEMMEGQLFAGWSVGQAIVVPVSVFADLGYNIVGGDHTTVGQLLRNEVAHKVLHDADYSSRAGRLPALSKSTNQTEDGIPDYNKAYDDLDATRSRVLIVDTNNTFGHVHPYLVTPLSGHFPWGELNELPRCTGPQKKKIQAGFSYSIDFVFAGMEILKPVELVDACLSNNHFRLASPSLFSSVGENCFQMTQRRQHPRNVTVKYMS